MDLNPFCRKGSTPREKEQKKKKKEGSRRAAEEKCRNLVKSISYQGNGQLELPQMK